METGSRGQDPVGWCCFCLLAFGVAMLAIIALHKLRERQHFQPPPPREQPSPHFPSAPAAEYTKQLKGKAEETKAKMNSLRKQKMELDHRLLEMLSTIDSLKD
ncbi:hypothetical protein PVK06_047049 [Gossypium arboreum]|uniref:Uncharacterized protein n=1 Tax=Gossypium arboreum TaxID=29729 RepID=A0ABR0MCA0_GOSAR|nr:hypothetical protein PVK06_047049 [Gossypium arboreum]